MINGVSGASGSAVVMDDANGTTQALDHLRHLGHSRIAYANTDRNADHPSVIERHHAYLDYLKTHGLEPIPGHEPGAYDFDDYDRLLRDMVQVHGATAVVTYHHWIAVRIYRAAQAMGLSIPEDFSVLTFNDSHLGQNFLSPALTAIAKPIGAIAEAATDLLREQIGSKKNKRRVVTLLPHLVERQSTAAPRGDA